MKSKLIVCAVAASMAFGAFADVLYWQVADTTTTPEYQSAYLMAKDGSGNLYYFTENVTQSGSDVGAVGSAAPTIFADGGYAAATFNVAKLASWDNDTAYSGAGFDSSWSFYVELWNSTTDFNDSTWAGQSTPMSYTDVSNLVKSGFDPSFSGVNGAIGSAALSSYTTAAPEPTSGLLMLIGLGALALRRKRA